MNLKSISLLAAVPLLMSGCAVAPKTFYADPTSVKDTALCRTFFDAYQSGNEQYARDLGAEGRRRGISLEQCEEKVNTENAILVGAAVVATGAAVIAACQGGGCSGYSAPAYGSPDYDCYGGGGDGPNYVRGPFRLTGPDVYDLDRDGDGIACEPHQDAGA
jgi:hypothetical protein